MPLGSRPLLIGLTMGHGMKKLSSSQKQGIIDLKKRISFYGTPEANYQDSGLWEYLTYVKTVDEHDKIDPFKTIPPKEYLLQILNAFLRGDIVAIAKSRQIMVSWAMAIFCSWFARTAPARRIVWQSKKEFDAFSMVTVGHKDPYYGRISIIEHSLPWFLQDAKATSPAGNTAGMIRYSNRSVIIAVPEGADHIRSHTASLIISDEASFQDQFEEAFVAARPAITGGGKMIIASTAAPSFFERLVHSYETDSNGQPADGVIWNLCNGVRTWRTDGDVLVLEVHYSADPDKNPATENGAIWYEQAQKGYVGGTSSAGWQREMEINWNILGGEPVFPFLADPRSKIFVGRMNPEVAVKELRIVAGYDYGIKNPSALVICGMDKRGNGVILEEIYASDRTYMQQAESFKNSPYWPYIEEIVADPSIWSENQTTAAGIKSVAELFAEVGINFVPGRRGADVPMAQKFLADFWRNPDKPKVVICSNCVNTKRELQGLKWREHSSEKVAARSNALEKILDKNNHTWDAIAYLFDSRPQPRGGYVHGPRPNTSRFVMNKLLEKQREEASNGTYI